MKNKTSYSNKIESIIKAVEKDVNKNVAGTLKKFYDIIIENPQPTNVKEKFRKLGYVENLQYENLYELFEEKQDRDAVHLDTMLMKRVQVLIDYIFRTDKFEDDFIAITLVHYKRFRFIREILGLNSIEKVLTTVYSKFTK